ncbi:Hypothetical predicted protein, partial [Paramuricea clavata]
METKLFSIILCLLVLEATGSSLKNQTSIQHRTENASARSLSTQPVTFTIFFDFFGYGRQLYNYIYSRVPLNEKGSQFAFLMIARSEAKRWEVPKRVGDYLNAYYLPSLKTAQVYPQDAQSNLVIAGVTYNNKPKSKDIPFHAEQKIINVMYIMDRFYERVYGKVCPWLILLGSAFDTCCGKGHD